MSSNISMLVLFYFHRSFSIVVCLANYMVYRKLQPQFRFTRIRRMNNWIFITLVVEIVTGAVMYYIDVPGLMQLVHLVFASFLFAEQFYLFSIVRRK